MTIGHRWRSLRHDRLQILLAAAAMGTAVALPVVLLSVGGGVAAHEIAALQSSGYEITVASAGPHGVEGAHALADRIDTLPAVAAAAPVLSEAIDLFPGSGGATPVLAEGIVPAAFAATESPTERGLFPSPLPFVDATDTGSYANGTPIGVNGQQVLLSTPLAKQYGLITGDSVDLAASANGSVRSTYTVVGEFGIPPSSFGFAAAYGIVLGLTNLQSVIGSVGPMGDVADTILVALQPSDATDSTIIDATAAQIQAMVPYYGVSSLTDEAAQLRSSTLVLTGFYLALSSVALLVGLLFLVLVLLRRVDSQRRSVAIARAIGVPGAQVAAQWVRSGVLLAGIGVALGLVGGWAIVGLLARYGAGAVATAAGLAEFDVAELAYLSFGVVALGALAGLNAARSALRRPVGEALR
jgi:ABC-type lipoprotein release transport system permease subunit